MEGREALEQAIVILGSVPDDDHLGPYAQALARLLREPHERLKRAAGAEDPSHVGPGRRALGAAAALLAAVPDDDPAKPWCESLGRSIRGRLERTHARSPQPEPAVAGGGR